jgi:hypothetical protein
VSDIFPAAMQRRLEAEWAKPAIKIDVTAIPDYSPDRHELPAGKQANIYNVAYLLLMAGVNPDLRVQIWRHGRPIMVGQIGYAAARYVCEQSEACGTARSVHRDASGYFIKGAQWPRLCYPGRV